MQALVGFCYILIRSPKSARWLERTFVVDEVHALSDDLKLLIRFKSHHHLSDFQTEVSKIFDADDHQSVCTYTTHTVQQMCQTLPRLFGPGVLTSCVETSQECQWRSMMGLEHLYLGVDNHYIENLRVYTKHLDTPHGKTEFEIQPSAAKHLHHSNLASFLDELLHDAVAKLSTLIPVTISLPQLRSAFVHVFAERMYEMPAPTTLELRLAVQALRGEAIGVADFKTPSWLHGYFAQYLIKQSETPNGIGAWHGAYVRGLSLFVLGRFDKRSAIFGMPTEIVWCIAHLVVTW